MPSLLIILVFEFFIRIILRKAVQIITAFVTATLILWMRTVAKAIHTLPARSQWCAYYVNYRFSLFSSHDLCPPKSKKHIPKDVPKKYYILVCATQTSDLLA